MYLKMKHRNLCAGLVVYITYSISGNIIYVHCPNCHRTDILTLVKDESQTQIKEA